MKDEELRIVRHIEAVRNYLQACSVELLNRGRDHDASKLEEPEYSTYVAVQPELRAAKFGTDDYKAACTKLGPALEHHQATNRHHPEFHSDGIRGMTLIDILEMVCDWKASSERQGGKGILTSIGFCQERFGFSNELRDLIINTIDWLDEQNVPNRAEES